MGPRFNIDVPHRLRMPDPAVEDVLRTLGERVYAGRRALGVSQDWLGRACGLSQSEISRLEGGMTPSMRMERYARVLAVLRDGRFLGDWLPEQDDDRRIHVRTKRRPASDASRGDAGPVLSDAATG